MGDEIPDDDDYQARCLATILAHMPIRDWHTLWRKRCRYCRVRWVEDSDLGGGCPAGTRATAELSGRALPGTGAYTGVYPPVAGSTLR